VEPVKHDQQHTASWWEAKNPLGAEAVRLEEAVLESPHGLELFRISAIEGSQVQIGRGEVDVVIRR